MPKPSQRADVNNFIGGLITEASPLNFPGNSAADILNFDLNRDGTLQRRLGMDLEVGYTYNYIAPNPATLTGLGVTQFVWDNVAGNPAVSLVVVQTGNNLHFYNLNQSSISAGGEIGFLYLGQFNPGNVYSFASVQGMLVIAGGAESIAVVTCNTSNMTFSLDYLRLEVRDQWGVEENLDTHYETDPTWRSMISGDAHNYNLRNQSWGIPRKDQFGTLKDPIAAYFLGLNLFPSNSEQVWTGLQQQVVAASQDPFERLYTNLFTEALGISVKTAKGYFIIDLLRRGSSREQAYAVNSSKYPQLYQYYSPTVGLPFDYTPGGATCLTEFAGRIFYGGFSGQVQGGDNRSPNLDSYVVFSQLINSKKEFNKCYQDGDPTSRDTNDIVDTDGGFIRISGAQGILALVNIQTHLVVIAQNGIWAITGGTTDSGFTATNYKVSKVSTFGGISPNSVVPEGTNAFYWSADGIYGISKNEYGDVQVASLTLKTIDKFYRGIDSVAKASATGTYDPFSKKIRWIYHTGDLYSNTSVTKELVFDSTTNAFTVHEVGNLNNKIEIFGAFASSSFSDISVAESILAATDPVIANTEDVIITNTNRTSNSQSVRYTTIVQHPNGSMYLTFAWYRDASFVDWISYDGIGIDAKAFGLTGAVTAGDSAVDKQVPYLVMHFHRTEVGVDSNLEPLNQSSCQYRMQWSFANTVVSNKWTPLREAYRYNKARFVLDSNDDYDTGFEVITTKNKVRGKGKAFALYFETSPGKDCQIIGWNLTVNANKIT